MDYSVIETNSPKLYPVTIRSIEGEAKEVLNYMWDKGNSTTKRIEKAVACTYAWKGLVPVRR